MKLMKSAMLGVTVFALAAGSAWAADKDTEKNKSNVSNATRSEDSGFAKLDKNKDGYISKEEAKSDAKLSSNFDKWDLNNDGKLNRAEYLGARAKEDTVDRVTGKDDKPAGSGSTAKPK
jgi:EF hand domain-containing protein